MRRFLYIGLFPWNPELDALVVSAALTARCETVRVSGTAIEVARDSDHSHATSWLGKAWSAVFRRAGAVVANRRAGMPVRTRDRRVAAPHSHWAALHLRQRPQPGRAETACGLGRA